MFFMYVFRVIVVENTRIAEPHPHVKKKEKTKNDG